MNYKMLPWSYSRLTAFETCPWRFKLTALTKVVREKQGPELVEGNRVHKVLERYAKGEADIPAADKHLRPIGDMVRTAKGHKLFEHEFALTRALTPTGYWDADCWVRGKWDVGIIRDKSAIIIDYKNGKRKPDLEQLQLFAGSALSSLPHIEGVTTAYAWLQANKLDREFFTREDAVNIWRGFAIRVHRMEEAAKNDHFPKRPSGLCKSYCPVGKKNCEHCGQ